MFGPLNGKLTIKLELTKIDDGSYELSAEIRPHENLMWVNLQFRMHGENNVDFGGFFKFCWIYGVKKNCF